MAALVLGCSGLVGSNLLSYLAHLGWDVIGVSRTKPGIPVRFQHLPVDLLDAGRCEERLRHCPEITHVFFATRVKNAEHEEMSAKGVEMARNVLNALDTAGSSLRHVHLVQGTRWYVGPAGPARVPSREDDPRQSTPNPYYAQHDYVAARQKGKAWSWSSSRPCNTHGFSLGYPHNAIALVGVYAAISRELGLPLQFPGTATGFSLLHSTVDVGILCKAVVWISKNRACENQDYNVGNGDVFSWASVWPEIARFFGMQEGPVGAGCLAERMSGKDEVWQRIVRKYDLQRTSLKDLVGWEYGDHLFNKERSDVPSLIKLWQTGFHEVMDSKALVLETLQKYRDARIIP